VRILKNLHLLHNMRGYRELTNRFDAYWKGDRQFVEVSQTLINGSGRPSFRECPPCQLHKHRYLSIGERGGRHVILVTKTPGVQALYLPGGRLAPSLQQRLLAEDRRPINMLCSIVGRDVVDNSKLFTCFG